jgi:hypothetical protein
MSRRSVWVVVRVARIRIETAIVEVAAEDDEAAALAAVNLAKRVPATTWTIEPYDARSYQPHVQALVTSEELIEGIKGGGTETTREEEVDVQASATRYPLLKANCDTGEGELVPEPWINVDEPDLLTSDICRAWITALEQAGPTHMADRLDDLAAKATPTVSDNLFGAKQPRKRKSG